MTLLLLVQRRQLEAFGEIFESKKSKERFQNKNYKCPFDARIELCDKPNRSIEKYGNCSACIGTKNRIICPRRFYENDYKILKDIRNFIFGNITVNAYDEVKLSKKIGKEKFDYGNLDWILSVCDDSNKFIGVEIQTDATTKTGSFKQAIDDLLKDKLKEKYDFGLNTLASLKGFLPQFIFKGQLFDEWKIPYVAVMQDELWEQFIAKFKIQSHEIKEYSTETFLFFIYSLERKEKFHIKKKKIMATRWVDLLFSFAVDGELLINYNEAREIVSKKISNYKPISTF